MDSPLHGKGPLPAAVDAVRAMSAPRRPLRVAVLGAGMAGLVAAYELSAKKVDVHIFEAGGRIGGRVFSHRFGDGSIAELGAARIPQSHDLTRHYVGELGLAGYLMPMAAGMENARCLVDLGDDGVESMARLADGPGARCGGFPPHGRLLAILDERIRSAAAGDIEAFLDHRPVARFHDIQNLDLDRFLEAHGVPRQSVDFLARLLGIHGWRQRPLCWLLRYRLLNCTPGLEYLTCGLDRIPAVLSQSVGAAVCQDSVVESIREEPHRVCVSVCRNGASEQMVFDYVICTIPFTVLRNLELTGVSGPIRQAIVSARYSNAAKFSFLARERTWESGHGIFGGVSVLAPELGLLFYPGDNARLDNGGTDGLFCNASHFRPIGPRSADRSRAPGVLTVLTLGRTADRLALLPAAMQRERALRSVARLHPEIAADDMLLEQVHINWREQRWARGAYLEAALGRMGLTALHGRMNRTIFAGDHCSTMPAWMQGAVESGLRATRHLLRQATAQPASGA